MRRRPWRGACLTASWNADGRLLAAGMQDGSVHLWNIASDDESEMPGLGAKVFATGWSGNGRFLAAAAAAALVVWDFGGKGADASRPYNRVSAGVRYQGSFSGLDAKAFVLYTHSAGEATMRVRADLQP